MNRKRNVSYIKPEDPEFLKVIKRQAGFDDRNHKFDELQNAEEDFVDDEESEKPQVVVLKKGDLTAEEAEAEEEKIKKIESETKADLTQRVLFKAKQKVQTNHKVIKHKEKSKNKLKKGQQLLSFTEDDIDSE